MTLESTISIEGPWGLLRRLREAMATPLSTQERLDKIVGDIAEHMGADVCSAYFRKGNDELELFATKGLNPEAVHQTRLGWGEGLVGQIAATGKLLNLPDAQTHPNFAYKPETGEELFHSFLGVPLLRGGRLLGVLVVQNQSERTYGPQDVEALQTVGMVFAELIAAGEVLIPDSSLVEGLRFDTPLRLRGTALADGIVVGHAVLHQPRVEVTRLIADDLDKELERLEDAVADLREDVDALVASDEYNFAGESADVLEAYRMFAHDRGWLERMREAVNDGLTAEAAVEKVMADTRKRLVNSPDAYLKERLNDFEDLSNRLLRLLIGTSNLPGLPEDGVIVARNMGPAELLDYDRSKLKGVVLEEGSATAHVTIVARALDLPLVGSAKDVVDLVEPGDVMIVDGESGDVHLRPQDDVLDVYRHKLELRTARQAQYHSDRGLPSVTKDGLEIALDINAGLLVDLPHLQETNAAGIGLFRTELQFMIGATMPRVPAQTDVYRKVLDAAEGRRVVFRAVDLGSDKVLPYLATTKEENPALGWRAVRLALDRPALLHYQIRAFLQAAAGRELNLMFPLIAEVAEFKAAREVFDREVARCKRFGHPLPSKVRLGTMLEVPSLAWQLDALLPLVDFVSIGSNDLFQFLFAWDRGNPKLTGRYDPLSPTVFAFLRNVVEKAAAYNVPLSLCGEMAGKPIEAMALIGLGLRRISMPPASVGPVKAMIRSLDVAKLTPIMGPLLTSGEHSVRDVLINFAQDNGIVIE
ncbi:MAG: phosphoenolpyruvate--protein phosphotransferase [Alphaproteobacteria bacterium]|nr:MAG: phosphoenolpyruvate--protein phosphotransferase [Alphaproteobacteria bacterium]